ncbi:hypothetical protein [Oceanobacillus indicireducens]|uniref:Uncharacterized protein n=1 Tax=Oceanobacillus indicireducens TaxID=1004261 RepID=A0A918D264_9BACI|nr:hypothetical protein [Oceanobacillus indicireducens]GGN60040.1 hypothetical protein GCM10007971_23710 [Oceanobacillus indicireducens]
MSETLDEYIQTKTSFITDIEEVVDILYDMGSVFLYDTSAISSHELVFQQINDLTFHKYTQGFPILLTDTIAKEMRLVEDVEHRYLTYLSHFDKVLYIKEENLIDLLKTDYELGSARSKFLIASERAFRSIQRLKEQVKAAKQRFSQSEKIIYQAFDSFFQESTNANRGELSLLWVAAIIEQLPGKTTVSFVGMDHDLYDFVERSYFSTTNFSPFSNDIVLLSNDTLLQSCYRINVDKEALAKLIPIFRKPDRKTRYFRKINKVLNLNQQKEKMDNREFEQLVINDEIEILY